MFVFATYDWLIWVYVTVKINLSWLIWEKNCATVKLWSQNQTRNCAQLCIEAKEREREERGLWCGDFYNFGLFGLARGPRVFIYLFVILYGFADLICMMMNVQDYQYREGFNPMIEKGRKRRNNGVPGALAKKYE